KAKSAGPPEPPLAAFALPVPVIELAANAAPAAVPFTTKSRRENPSPSAMTRAIPHSSLVVSYAKGLMPSARFILAAFLLVSRLRFSLIVATFGRALMENCQRPRKIICYFANLWNSDAELSDICKLDIHRQTPPPFFRIFIMVEVLASDSPRDKAGACGFSGKRTCDTVF